MKMKFSVLLQLRLPFCSFRFLWVFRKVGVCLNMHQRNTKGFGQSLSECKLTCKVQYHFVWWLNKTFKVIYDFYFMFSFKNSMMNYSLDFKFHLIAFNKFECSKWSYFHWKNKIQVPNSYFNRSRDSKFSYWKCRVCILTFFNKNISL